MPYICIPDAPKGLTHDDYAFTLTDLAGRKWDVYHYRLDENSNITRAGRLHGTLAFRYDNGLKQWIIGILCSGHLTEDQALAKILEGRR